MHSYKAIATACVFAVALGHVNAQHADARREDAPQAFESLGSTVNSAANEQNPLLSADGQTLYFTRQYHPDNMGGTRDAGDIWFSTLQADGSWSAAQNIGAPLNNTMANSIIGLADGGNTLFLHGHYYQDDRKVNTQGISVARKNGRQWSFPEPVAIPYYYSKSDHLSGTLHASGNIMLVSLQSYDTRGAEDLYALFRKSDGSWSEPKNLGSTINTAYQEMTPFLAPDGKTLYFSSNGYEGFGSRDVFMSVRLDDSWKRWSKPQNLGPSVNTEGTELFYRLVDHSEDAYLASTQNSDGLGDLVRLQVDPELVAEQKDTATITVAQVPVAAVQPEPEEAAASRTAVNQVTIAGTVLHKNTQAPVQAQIQIKALSSDTVGSQPAVETNEAGQFSLSVAKDQPYQLVVSADGFIKASEKLMLTENSESVERQILLTPLEVGATVKLENVLFDRGTANMLPGSEESLNEVISLMNENPNLAIEVAGHTDNQGRADLNLLLSQERAQTVKAYMVGKGIAPERIQDKGYGGTRPVASNAIEEERMKNRRVEFTITRK